MAQGIPSDLESLKEPLIEAVIDAYMKKEIPATVDGMEWDHGGVSEGEFRYKHSRFGKDAKAYCYYPSGEWKIDIWVGGDHDASPGDNVDSYFELFDAAATFEMIRTNVSEWIEPWIACQDPHVLADAIASLGDAVNALYVQSEVRIEDRLGAGADDSGNPGTNSPLADIRSAVVDIGSLVETLGGNAIEALKAAYITDVGLTISGQRALAAIATLAIAGEAEAWSQAFGNLADYFGQSTKDFKSFADGHGASEGGSTLSVISGVTGLAALATAEFPPAAVTLGAISGIAGLGATFFEGDGEEAVPTVTLVLDSSNFDTMWSSFKDGVRDVNSAITDAEYSLAMMCRGVLADYGASPDSYSITSVGQHVDNPQPGDNLPGFLGAGEGDDRKIYGENEVFIVHSKLRQASGRIEHIGDHQREVAGRLSSSGLSSNSWERQYLDGSIIGWGPSGHHGDYVSVVDALIDLLLLEAKTAHRIAEHAFDISTGFAKTDSEIEAGLDRLESRFS
ncbi:MAG: hypothetical protein JWO76_756 [Nocardioides sp.]|nr:hypothetical protein [Nocardioides sp.]